MKKRKKGKGRKKRRYKMHRGREEEKNVNAERLGRGERNNHWEKGKKCYRKKRLWKWMSHWEREIG